MSEPANILLLLLMLPLWATALILLAARGNGPVAAIIGSLSGGAQAALALFFLYGVWDGTALTPQVPWFSLGPLDLNFGFFLNTTSALLLFVVCLIGFLIQLFAVGYSSHDPHRARFFVGLNLFMFSMTGLVLSGSLIMLFFFWELVGLCSYLLIGHYRHEKAAKAANKAFIVNRIGDLGLLIGIIWCFWNYGTTDLFVLESLFYANPDLFTGVTAAWLSLCIFCGVLGKSAQLPLHVWLPDAMEGPTPVSALIHAATMVAAGVFLLGRVWFIFPADVLPIITLLGAATALYAALCAFGARDIKQVLAFSTLSQLGYLVAAFGMGAAYALGHPDSGHPLLGVGSSHFHLTTHAFFKALLFLCAGSVIHAAHHEQDIFKLGGLWKKMPLTTAFFGIGVIAIAGIPPLSGFFSKDAILYLAQTTNLPVFILLAATAFLTSLYMGRVFVITFLGRPRSEAARHAHENGPVMLLPLLVLAVGAVLSGFLWFYPASFSQILDANVLHPKGADHTFMLILSLALGLGGLGLAAILYYRPEASADWLEKGFPAVFRTLHKRFYFDDLYAWYVNEVQQRLAHILAFLDMVLFSGIVVRGSAAFTSWIGSLGRAMHTGNLQGYLYWFFGGLAIFWIVAAGLF